MLVYEKKVEDLRKVFGTLENIPSQDDSEVSFTDASGNTVELSQNSLLLDNGKHGMLDENGNEVFAWIDEVNIIPGAGAAIEVASEEEFEEAISKGGYVKLTSDINITKRIDVTADTILDLQGHTISNTEDIWDKSVALLVVNAHVTLLGGGKFIAKENDCYGINVIGGSLDIIDAEVDGNISAVQVQKGVLTIKGGEYKIQQQATGKPSGYDFLLNCIDAAYRSGEAVIKVMGGTFYGFNPQANAAESKEQTTNFCAEGYHAEEVSEGVFVVVADTEETTTGE